jgi:hypothetical protein
MSDPRLICHQDVKTQAARLCLISVYAALSEHGDHLLASLVGNEPQQWKRYPEDDAIDLESGFQWFYHAHSPEDRCGSQEHGHIHLFARKPLWGRRMRSHPERSFASLCGSPQQKPNTRHLLAISFDAKGLPLTIFTVNSWVTGDLMLSAPLTITLLDKMRLNTGFSHIDAVIESVATLCRDEIVELLGQRDQALRGSASDQKLADETLEILSEIKVDLDSKLSAAFE